MKRGIDDQISSSVYVNCACAVDASSLFLALLTLATENTILIDLTKQILLSLPNEINKRVIVTLIALPVLIVHVQ